MWVYGKFQSSVNPESYGRLGNRHNGGANCGYLDGHCETKKAEVVYNVTTVNSYDLQSRLWAHYQAGK